MARGWESKSVEDQISAKEPGIRSSAGPEPSSKRAALLLAKTRIENAMKATQQPDRLEFLQRALTDLDLLLAKLETTTDDAG